MRVEMTEWFKLRFGLVVFDFDASRRDRPRVEVYQPNTDGAVLDPRDAEQLGTALLAWAQRYGGGS
jgi:hypothetical protein